MEDKVKLVKVLLETTGGVNKETVKRFFDITDAGFSRVIQAFKKKYGKTSIRYDRKSGLYLNK